MTIWQEGGTTFISYKLGHQVVPPVLVTNLVKIVFKNFGHLVASLPLVANLATMWRDLHWSQIWPPGGATCTFCKLYHQVAPLASPRSSFIVIICLYWAVSSSARVISVNNLKFLQQDVRDIRTHWWDPKFTWVDEYKVKNIARIDNVVMCHSLDWKITIICCLQKSTFQHYMQGFTSSSEIIRRMTWVFYVFVVGLWGLGLSMVLNSSISSCTKVLSFVAVYRQQWPVFTGSQMVTGGALTDSLLL